MTAPITAAHDSRKSVREDGTRFPFLVSVGIGSARRYYFATAEKAAAFIRALAVSSPFRAGVLAPSGKSYTDPWASLKTRGDALEVCVAVCDHHREVYADFPEAVAGWLAREVETRALAEKYAEARERRAAREARVAAAGARDAAAAPAAEATPTPITDSIVGRLLADEAATRGLLRELVGALAALRSTEEPTEEDDRALSGPVWDTLGPLIEDGQEAAILREATA